MIGRKIYYELATGDVILTVPEKHGQNAINTTKEQDFQMYDVLTARSPETVGVIQLDYGQYQAEFQSARSVKVDLETNELLFEYPEYVPPITEQVNQLKIKNSTLEAENTNLKNRLQEAEQAILELSTIMGLIGGMLNV